MREAISMPSEELGRTEVVMREAISMPSEELGRTEVVTRVLDRRLGARGKDHSDGLRERAKTELRAQWGLEGARGDVHSARAKPTEQPRRIIDDYLVRGHSAPIGGQHGQPAVGRKAGRVCGELEGCEERAAFRRGEASSRALGRQLAQHPRVVLQRRLGHDTEGLEHSLRGYRYTREGRRRLEKGLTRSGAGSEGSLRRDEGGAAPVGSNEPREE